MNKKKKQAPSVPSFLLLLLSLAQKMNNALNRSTRKVFAASLSVIILLTVLSSWLHSIEGDDRTPASSVLVVPSSDRRAPSLPPRPVIKSDYYDKWRCPSGTDSAKTRAVASFLVSTNNGYIQGAGVLGRSLVRHLNHTDTEQILMVLDTVVLNDEHSLFLARSGWTVCQVPLIESAFQAKVFPRFREQFTKLALFTWTRFKKVAYLDLDTLVVADLSGLFECQEKLDPGLPTTNSHFNPRISHSCEFSASQDYADGHFREGSFNAGVLVIKPSLPFFDQMMTMIATREDYRVDMAEQGALNEVLRHTGWHQLPLEYNANLAIYMQDINLWAKHRDKMSVIHYTMVKPFDLAENAQEREWEPLEVWFEQAETTAILITSTGLFSKLLLNEQLEKIRMFWNSTKTVDVIVFTDSTEVLGRKDDPNLIAIRHKQLGWPMDSLQRPGLYLSQEALLKSYTYLFSLDADLVPFKEVTSAINGDLVGLIHPGFRASEPKDFTFERRPESSAYIAEGEGEHYYQASIYGGKAANILELWKALKSNLEADSAKGLVAVWHEESHLNRYFLEHPPTLQLGASYSFPTGWNIPEESMIIEHRDKKMYGGHQRFRA